MSSRSSALHVAIIGGGITGINLALGLQARNVAYTVYERAAGFREIGAGLGFSPNAERAMHALDPRLLAVYKRVANPNGEDYFQWVDGTSDNNQLLFKLFVGQDGFQGCRRSDYLDAVSKLVRPDCVQFGKEVRSFSEELSGKIKVEFCDGSNTEADVVIGCDGIRSRVRQIMLGQENPAAHPTYTHKACLRALVPMEQARAAIGEYAASTRFMYNGPDAHIITYPIGMNTILNVLVVLSDPDPWNSSDGKHTAQCGKEEAVAAFANWGPTARAIVGLLPEQLDKWAVFDMGTHPAASYAQGSVCLAGDAAHAVGPHLGSGAGLGIEDALTLATLLEAVQVRAQGDNDQSPKELAQRAFLVYNRLRYQRTQSVVQSTRTACHLFQWNEAYDGKDPVKFGKEITERFHAIWDYDVNEMIHEAVSGLE